ncbi:response regulator transcription factor [Chloroflexota bacterium]
MSDKIEKSGTILVIDDEPAMLALFERILKPEGYDVLSAADGIFGLSLLRQAEPDLILLDIMMPGPDGFEVLQRIRQSSNVPVIMVTAKRDTELLQKALSSGADDHITKPFRPAELVARIRAKLRRAW